jgi:hypothetical protein
MPEGNVQSDNLYIYIHLNYLHFLIILKNIINTVTYIIVFQIKHIITQII